jgi:ABC-2 type transport system ATP-binding protein
MNVSGSDILVSASNLKFKYSSNQEYAVDNLSFNINKGEIFGLLGPNGAGKTTTINILTGLLKPGEGHASIASNDINANLDVLKSLIGIVPQDISLFSNLTVIDNLLIFGTLYGINKKVLKGRIEFFLKKYGLEQKINEKVRNLSGGLRRRLNIIIGILHSPRLLILDEPTVGIDVQSKIFILSNLRDLNNSGLTILYTSHYMDEAEKFCSKIAIINMGRIIACDSPQVLIEKTEGCRDLEDVFLKLTGRKIRD